VDEILFCSGTSVKHDGEFGENGEKIHSFDSRPGRDGSGGKFDFLE
jgi:hypothetical protein